MYDGQSTSVDGFFFEDFRKVLSAYESTFKSKESEDSQKVREAGWFATLDALSGGDRTKWDYYLDMNMIAGLNYLSFFVVKKKREAEQIKNANKRK